MSELEILESPTSYVNLINLYRKNKALIEKGTTYNYIDIKEQEKITTKKEVEANLIPTALVISCGYSIDMLGGDHKYIKPNKR